jgi:hypothetical protein
VGKDVCEPLLCAVQGDESAAEQSAETIVKDNILAFSRQNSKLAAAEADFERLLKNKDETNQLFKLLCEGAGGLSLLKIEVRCIYVVVCFAGDHHHHQQQQHHHHHNCCRCPFANRPHYQVWMGLHYNVLLGDGLRHAFAVVTVSECVSRAFCS